MSTPILATKLYIPQLRPNAVSRPRLTERLNEGLHHNRKLTLIAAPAGFGKTSLLSEWVAGCDRKAAWLSLDQADSDPIRFLTYFVAALQKIAPNIGEGVQRVLQSLQPSPIETMLTTLLNEITTFSDNFVLVLDDYHLIEAKAVDDTLSFLLEHLPSQMHLVIATREDPNLPLARLRVRGQLTELRAADLRFTPFEADGFLKEVMGLDLLAEDVAALENRTEGWIAGLQLAALSLQGHQDPTNFIQSFTGNHHFVLDYLLAEVLQQQSASVQTFLLRTSILDRLCGSLCNAIMRDPSASLSGQETLEYLEHANLFIVPLDNERRWYRYHHLFADLLRQRLHQSAASPTGDERESTAELHIRASQWYEDNGLEIEAFQHAAATSDVERAERLIAGNGIPLHFRGAVTAIVNWLESLPETVLNARPWLWWRHASLLLIIGQTTGVGEKLQAAEAALAGLDLDDKTRNLTGQIAGARAVLALTRYDIGTMLAQSRRALEYLHPDNLSSRANANWTLGYAHFLQGDRAPARRAFTEAISLSQAAGDIFTTILATGGLGQVLEAENQLHLAAEAHQRVLELAGEQPLQIISGAHLGLARIFYEWNDLEAAERHGRQSLKLARQYESVIDRFIVCEVFLARVKLAQGDVGGATAILAQTSQSARQQHFVHRLPEVADVQVLTMLHQGQVTQAAHLAQTHAIPLSQARVHLAQSDTSAALAVLKPLLRQVETKGLADERLKIMVLYSVALHAQEEKDRAVKLLGEALRLAEPGGFIRIFIDEGTVMAQLLFEAASLGIMPDYTEKLLAVFEAGEQRSSEDKLYLPPAQPLVEPLSQRELEVLHLIAQGHSNREISQQLFLALSTVKGHNRLIFEKLEVQSRTEAVARGRELGLL